jgi:glycyl-tRNA synthetase
MSQSDSGSKSSVEMETLVSLCARRGFIFASSEIYGGISGFWDYGPLGAELKRNFKDLWWQRMVRERGDVEGLDSSIIAHPRTWEASGHVDHFTDPMVDCRQCKRRFRADQLDDAGKCAAAEKGSAHDFTEARDFNLMLQTRIGASEEASTEAHLRPETCQSIFTSFKRVREAARQKIPFGIAQIGKAFRNEITPRNFTFRSREFEQAELEFFVHPSEHERWFDYWKQERLRFHQELFDADSLRMRPHASDELAHYAQGAEDVEFLFPFGWQEIEGVHDRGDWDLSRHSEFSGKDLAITDEQTKERYTPVVIETSVGVDRSCLALLCDAYREEEIEGGDKRVVLRFHPAIAPIKVAVLPLSKKLEEPARELEAQLRPRFATFYDQSGNIGRRYRRQDEVGTPFCVTVDFDTADDGKVTVRDRDSMEQQRVPQSEIVAHLRERLEVGL